MSTPQDLRLQVTTSQVLKMALPISMALFVPQINFIVNNIFLGGLGQRALASAGITGVYYLIFAVIGNGLNNGLQALIARRAGQNLHKEIGKLFFNGVWVALAISAIGIITTYTLGPVILRATLHDPFIADQVVSFLYIRIWGLPILYLYVMRNALLVGTNQTKILIWGTFAEASMNVFMDYGLIYGKFGMPELGFNGAAYASIVAEATGLIVIWIVIHFKKIHQQFAMFEQKSIDFPTVKLILVQSSPLIVQYAISIISWEFFYILIEHHGEMALAVSNGMRVIFGLFGTFSWAFASTTSAMVSNIIGQKRHAEVLPLIVKVSTISFLFALAMFIPLNIWPELFVSLYGQGQDYIDYAIPSLRVVSVAILMMSFATVWLNGVTGTGNTVVNLTIESVTIVIYSIYVWVVLEVMNLPITWGWGSEWVYWISMFSMAFFYLKSGRWKTKVI
ncbi:MAG TPA: MATE family efflux transporter [Cyclobacteriaceae bacterium]|nr:MATE family efflux transporter [Cyclobacteriaceae bacterium]